MTTKAGQDVMDPRDRGARLDAGAAWLNDHGPGLGLDIWLAACEWQHIRTTLASLHDNELAVLRMVARGVDHPRAMSQEKADNTRPLTKGWATHYCKKLQRLGLLERRKAQPAPGVFEVWALTELGRMAL